MSNNELRQHITDYLAGCNITRNRIFSRHIKPFFDQTIKGVLLSLQIFENTRNDYEDLQQEAMLKLILTLFQAETLAKIYNIRGYTFILARNAIIDQIRKANNYGKYLGKYEQELIAEGLMESDDLEDNIIGF